MKTAAFTLSQLQQQQREAGKSWLEFLDSPSMSMGIYRVAAGTDDRDSHEPHRRDEVYVGIEGKGRLNADGIEFEVAAGDVVLVKAGVEHYFHDVTEDLAVLVFFAGSNP